MSRLAALLLVLALAAPAATAGPRLKTVRSGAVTLGLPATWKVHHRGGAGLVLLATAPAPQDGFLANVNVIAGDRRGGAPLSRWRSQLVAGLRAAGISVSSARTRLVRLPAGRAVEVRYAGTLRGKRLRWLAYALDTRTKGYVLTFTTTPARYARDEALFRAMARSLRLRG